MATSSCIDMFGCIMMETTYYLTCNYLYKLVSTYGIGAMIIPDLGTIIFNPSICLAFNTNFDVGDMTVLCASSYANNVVHLHLLGTIKGSPPRPPHWDVKKNWS
jgi:hypothetical protein